MLSSKTVMCGGKILSLVAESAELPDAIEVQPESDTGFVSKTAAKKAKLQAKMAAMATEGQTTGQQAPEQQSKDDGRRALQQPAAQPQGK